MLPVVIAAAQREVLLDPDDLRTQLEGSENRINIARNRYIKTVQDYNVLVRQFPQNLTAMAFGYKEKAQFAVENEAEIKSAPTVDFGTKK